MTTKPLEDVVQPQTPKAKASADKEKVPNEFSTLRTGSTNNQRSFLQQLQFSPSPSYQSSDLKDADSPKPAHGIHVNPKYLEARRQLETSSTETSTHKTSSNSKDYCKGATGWNGRCSFRHKLSY